MFVILLRKALEFISCEGLIVFSSGYNILAMARAILWIALPMIEIMGRREGAWFMAFG